jgi:hypothetical protein
VSYDAQNLIESLICEREDRLGSRTSSSASRPNSRVQRERAGFVGEGIEHGAEEIKVRLPSAPAALSGVLSALAQGHAWFRGVDFGSLHLQSPPFQPELKSVTDTRYFEDLGPDAQPLAPPDGHANPDQTRDPLLRHAEHGKDLLEVRKALAFVG